MVQLLIKLVAAEEGSRVLISALRTVMRGARQIRGCKAARVYCSEAHERQIDYLEEWDDAIELRKQFSSERFLHLLGLLETVPERPVVEFRIISAIYGLEYITAPNDAELSNKGTGEMQPGKHAALSQS